jgi:hypothetical protein
MNDGKTMTRERLNGGHRVARASRLNHPNARQAHLSPMTPFETFAVARLDACATRGTLRLLAFLFLGVILASSTRAEPPSMSHIFPAGGQRGTTVGFRVGGFYFHGQAEFEMDGPGVKAGTVVKEADTIWFEGPMILKPESQKKEDYPKDHPGEVRIDAKTPLGVRHWRCRTSQGVTPSMKFVVGDLPEIVEKEIDGAPIPETVSLPVTINGRVFPREDVDLWRFRATKGETITCEVASRSLGYPLAAMLEVTGPDGRTVAGVRKQVGNDGDPRLWFTAPADGEYQAAIHDVGFGGGPNFVYRLTLRSGPRVESIYPLGGRRGETVQLQVSGPGSGSRTVPISLVNATGDSVIQRIPIDGKPAELLTLHVDDLPEILEREPNDEPSDGAAAIALPAMLNGRIDRAGDVDFWPLQLENGQTIMLDVLAEQLGSRLDSVLTIQGADGKELTRNDDRIDGQPDSRLIFTAPKEGRYLVRISDRFSGRGGPDFAYRLRASVLEQPDFALTFATDAFNAIRPDEKAEEAAAPDGKKKPAQKGTGIRVDIVPLGAFAKDVTLEVEGLPAGVTADRTVITSKQKFVEIRFTVPPRTPIQVARVTIRGTADVGGKSVTRVASLAGAFGEPRIETLRLAIVPAVPFKHIGHYLVVNDLPGGTTMTKHYELDRGGFEGPIAVSLADRQGRCLQGVNGPPVTVPPGAAGFEYTVNYPPDVELGRTSRIQLMLVGALTDFDGSRHTISYTSFENDNQMISVVSSGLLQISTHANSYPARPNTRVVVPVSIQRHPSLAGRPVRLELALPRHVGGVTAQPVEVPADADKGTLVIEFGGKPGPFNMPVRVVARTTAASSAPHSAEVKIDLVPPYDTPAQ